MKVIFVLFDSLNRHALSCYGGALPTPNFDRLAARSTVFDRHFIGSMPCMPARRDMHTGRLNFLHRSWGPLEPFDASFPHTLKESGTYTHLVSDHYHYFEAGGATYHTAYETWDFIRGQEADPWVAMVEPPIERLRKIYHQGQFEETRGGFRLQGMLNREAVKDKDEFPCVKCFDSALKFLSDNDGVDNWMLHLETFDPHEPYHAPEEFRAKFNTGYQGPILDWPRYRPLAGDSEAEVAELRANYAALVALCDDQLGRLLDHMDAHDMWDDTALVMTTDHGFLLGEHDWWGKNRMPFYNEIAAIPLMIHLPGQKSSARCGAVTQNIDVMPTILELFGAEPQNHVLGHSLVPLAKGQGEGRGVALFGIFGGALNITDGHHTYFLYPEDMEAWPLFEYTLMPVHAQTMFTVDELSGAKLHPGFPFTQGAPILKIPATKDARRPPLQGGGFADTRNVLFNIDKDFQQTQPLDDPATCARFVDMIVAEMDNQDAPPELYQRFSLTSKR